jgi:uncharacterized protein (TIGR00304 family)
MNAETLYRLGIALVFVGILITLAAVVLLFVSSVRGSRSQKGKVTGGGVIIIGPFPIVFGTDKESIRTILLLSIALTILLIIVMVIFHLALK